MVALEPHAESGGALKVNVDSTLTVLNQVMFYLEGEGQEEVNEKHMRRTLRSG